jgi:hypothetical protein
MFEFSQYLGFIFLTILTIGSVNVFLVGSVSYWVGGATWEAYKEKKLKERRESSKLIFLYKRTCIYESFFLCLC